LPDERQSFVSMRAGTQIGGFGVSLFVDNLTDSHTILNYNHQTNTYGGAEGTALMASPAYRYISYRPRTFGITVVFRH
jgi:hypothetical protein